MIRGFLILMLVTFAGSKAQAGVCLDPKTGKGFHGDKTTLITCPPPNQYYDSKDKIPSYQAVKTIPDTSILVSKPLAKPAAKLELPPLPTVVKKGCTYSDDAGGSIYSPTMKERDCKDMGGKFVSEKQAKQSQANLDAEVYARAHPKEAGAPETDSSKEKKEDSKKEDTVTRTAAADDAAIATYTKAQSQLASDRKQLEADQKQLDQLKAKDDRLAELNKKQKSYEEQNKNPDNLSDPDYKQKALTKEEQDEQTKLAAGSKAREVNEGNLQTKVEDGKKAVSDDKQAVSAAKEDYEQAKADEDIAKKNENENYGGHYQGASVNTTEKINQGATLMSQATEKLGESAVKQSSDDAAKALAEKGATATEQNVIDAHNSVKDKAASKLTTAGILNMALGAYQAFRGAEHFKSIGSVDETALNADGIWSGKKTEAEASLKTAQAALEACVAPACTTQAALQKAVEKAQGDLNTATDNLTNIHANHSGENEAQSGAGTQQAIVASTSILKGASMLNDAKNLEAHLGQAAAGKQFNMANNQGFQGGGPTDPTLAPIVEQSAIVQNDPAAKPELGGREQFNPNDPSAAPQGPVATAWQDAPAAVGQSGGGGGVGGVGSTSAASTDSPGNPQAGAQPKAGSYASSGSGGGSYKGKSAGGSGAKVGVDSGFADLLKKFLPGGEADKKKNVNAAVVNFADRSPASDQAAVISRNKNIFDEIHKRYEKKNNEGAIVF
jgi:hypothetical protein